MLNIVVPMAGRGSRFSEAGFEKPKPLIDVADVPMIQLVISNLLPAEEHRFIFICQESHLEKYEMEQILRSLSPSCEIVPVNGVTQGAACTVLLAKELIDNGEPLMIANSDQWVDIDINEYLRSIPSTIDGLIMTMQSSDSKWSYARLTLAGNVCEVVEKKVVSQNATVGIYNFQRGCDFVRGAESMIERNLRSNGEFYVAPVYNMLTELGSEIRCFDIGPEGDRMHGLGTPSDLRSFLANAACKKAIGRAQELLTFRRAA